MKTLRRVYIGISLMITIGGYALVFGEVGYFKREAMRKEITNLEAKLSLLKSENHYLTKQYDLFKKKTKIQGRPLSPEKNITIIQFEEEKVKRQGLASFFSYRHDSMQESRLLFLAFMFLISSCGYLLLYHLSKEKRAGSS